MTPRDFLDLLWQYKPEEQLHPDLDVAGQAVPLVPRRRTGCGVRRGDATDQDVYVGVGLSKEDHGPARRCVSEEIAGHHRHRGRTSI